MVFNLVHECLCFPDTLLTGLTSTASCDSPELSSAHSADSSLVRCKVASLDYSRAGGVLAKGNLGHDVAVVCYSTARPAGAVDHVRFGTGRIWAQLAIRVDNAWGGSGCSGDRGRGFGLLEVTIPDALFTLHDATNGIHGLGLAGSRIFREAHGGRHDGCCLHLQEVKYVAGNEDDKSDSKGGTKGCGEDKDEKVSAGTPNAKVKCESRLMLK